MRKNKAMKIVHECYMTKGIISMQEFEILKPEAILQVNVTCTNIGKTVSIADTKTGIQFTIPAERLSNLLK